MAAKDNSHHRRKKEPVSKTPPATFFGVNSGKNDKEPLKWDNLERIIGIWMEIGR